MKRCACIWYNGKDIVAILGKRLNSKKLTEAIGHRFTLLRCILGNIVPVRILRSSSICLRTGQEVIIALSRILVVAGTATPQIHIAKEHAYRNKELLCGNIGVHQRTAAGVTELQYLTVAIPCRHRISSRILIWENISNEVCQYIIA